MQAKTALVRTKGGVELDTEAAVDLELTLVIFPDDAEVNDALGDSGDLESGAVFGVLLKEGGVLEGGGEFCGSEREDVSVEQVVFAFGSGEGIADLVMRYRCACPCRPARTQARKEGWT